MRLPIAVAALIACGSPSPRTTSRHEPPDNDPPLASTYETSPRAPASAVERTLAARGVQFDARLDCVARAIATRAPVPPDPARYRNAWPLRCGSPLYPLRAELIADDAALIAAVDALERDAPRPAAIVLGVASLDGKRAVVLARTIVVLQRVPREGATRIAGRLLVAAKKGNALISTERGVTSTPFEFNDDGTFAVALDAPRDATVELTFEGHDGRGPLARVALGAGSPLFRGDGSLLTRINEARRHGGLSPLDKRDGVGDCDKIPSQVAGLDVSDRARCFDVPLLDLDDLADEIMYLPLMQEVLMTPAASFIEIGTTAKPEPAIKVRVLKRFETMTPDAARQRIIEHFRERWPQVVERKTQALQPILDAWARDPDVFASSAIYKPAVDKLAATWTTTKRFYAGVSTGRDFGTALALFEPTDAPLAIDAASIQVRGKDGAMLHLIAVMFEMP